MSGQPDFYRMDHSRLHRWMIAGSHYATWFLGKRFPRSFPLVFVTGYPKSGTVWVTRMIADYFQMPYPHYSVLPIGCHSVVHGHQRVPMPDARGAYVMRDGRDALVSLYFHMSKSLPEGDNPVLTRKQRDLFPGLKNKANVRENFPAFLERQLRKPSATQGQHWGNHVQTYMSDDYKNFAGVKYEDLLANAPMQLTNIVEKISGEEADAERIQATVLKFSFERQSGRKRGSENRKGFLRKGTAGDWRNYFEKAAAEIFDCYCGEALIAAGYEPDRSWVDSLDNSQELKSVA